jgi:hypothetical protein
MLAHAGDAFFYAGDAAGAARTARALAATPFKGPRMAMHTAMDARFIEDAGSSAARGVRCAEDLAAAGFTGTGLSVGPVLTPAFLRDAGKAAEGWVFAEAYTDPSSLPSAKAFSAAHRKRFGLPPATWAAEAYDAVGLIAQAGRTTSATDTPRDGVAARIFRSSYRGMTRRLSFAGTTQRVDSATGILLYRVDKGRLRFLGPAASVEPKLHSRHPWTVRGSGSASSGMATPATAPAAGRLSSHTPRTRGPRQSETPPWREKSQVGSGTRRGPRSRARKAPRALNSECFYG